MNDFSLHILDLTENSLAAGADDIVISLVRRSGKKFFIIRDNGRGTALTSSQLLSPFYTTRTTRRVGMGLALMEHLVRICDGWIRIVPLNPKGMVLVSCMDAHHWDLPPDGKLVSTLLVLMEMNSHCRFRFNYGDAKNLVYIDSNEFLGLGYGEKKRQLELAHNRLGGVINDTSSIVG